MKHVRTFAVALMGSLGLGMMATGCAAERHEAIPSSAQLVAKGQTDVTYRAPESGTVYVYDRSTGEMVYSGRVRANDVVAVDAMKDRVVLNNTPVNEKKIKDFDEIKIYFQESPEARISEAQPAQSTIIREREVVQPRTSTSPDGTITIKPDRAGVTVDGTSDSKVTIEQPEGSKVTIQPGNEPRE